MAGGTPRKDGDSMITIYIFPRGARGVRVFWVCEEMGLPYRVESVNYPPSAEYMALNPMGSVPFLTDDLDEKEEGGTAINESVAMMLYVAERYGPTPLLPAKTDPAFARVIQMTVFGETTLGAYMNPLMMAKFAAPEGQKVNWVTGALENRLDDALSFVAGVLGDQQYFAGGTFTLADISVSTAFDMWTGALGKAVPAALTAWQARVKARPAYAQCRGGAAARWRRRSRAEMKSRRVAGVAARRIMQRPSRAAQIDKTGAKDAGDLCAVRSTRRWPGADRQPEAGAGPTAWLHGSRGARRKAVVEDQSRQGRGADRVRCDGSRALVEVERARADGRWAQAYDGARTAAVPDDPGGARCKEQEGEYVLPEARRRQPLRDPVAGADGEEVGDPRRADREIRGDVREG